MKKIPKTILNGLMDNRFSLEFRRSSGLFAGEFLVFGIIFLFLSNCSTVGNQMEMKSQDLDLSMSYAVKMYEQKRQQSQPLESKDPRAYFQFLISLEAEKKFQFEKAAMHYKEIVKYDPETEKFFEKWVHLLLRTGQLDKAIKAGQEALTRFPKNKVIHMDMADIFASQGKADSAIYHYERVSQINPKSSRAIFLKGTVLEEQGKWDQAKNMYLQSVKMEHGNPLGQFYLGRALLQNNKLVEAEKRFQMAVILKPN